jgi:hypothetical protein
VDLPHYIITRGDIQKQAAAQRCRAPLSGDSAAIVRPGNRIWVEERQRRCKRPEKDGLNSFSGELRDLRGAANLGREGNEWVDIHPVGYRERGNYAHPSKSGRDRRIEEARRERHASRGDRQAGGSDPARRGVASGKVSTLVAVRWRAAWPAGRVCRACAG